MNRLTKLLNTKPYPVADLLDWDDESKDEAVCAYLADNDWYPDLKVYINSINFNGPEDDANEIYQMNEQNINHEIAKFNAEQREILAHRNHHIGNYHD